MSWASPTPGPGVADLGVRGDHQEVAAERHVRATGHAEAVDLAHDGRGAVEQRHEAADVAAHHPEVDHRIPGARRVVVGGDGGWRGRRTRRPQIWLIRGVTHPLGRVDEVIAAAEALAVAREQDHLDRGVEVGVLHGLLELDDQLTRDAVAPVGPVERDAGDAVGGRVRECSRFVHARILLR